MKGALATAKLAVSDDRDAVDMLNRFDIALAGKAVKMSARLDKAFFDKLRERAEKHGKAVAMF
jgi:predicted DNA-binding ribbon-helix-helix protein